MRIQRLGLGRESIVQCERSIKSTLTGLLSWRFLNFSLKGHFDVTTSSREIRILAMGVG